MPKPTWPAPQMSTFMMSALQARMPSNPGLLYSLVASTTTALYADTLDWRS